MWNWRRRCAAAQGILLAWSACVLGAERPDDSKPSIERSRQVDPDLGDRLPAWEPSTTGGSAVGEVAAGNCASIGDFVLPASGVNRFRGNLYHFDVESRLVEVKMKLAFAGVANLYVSVHQKQQDGSYTRAPGWPASDVVIANAQGQGTSTPVFFSTGTISGGGVSLEPGDYAIGFAWTPSIIYARDNVTYPKPFSRGQVLGIETLNAASLPLPESVDFPDPFTGGAYAMQLCFLPVQGACCSTLLFGSEGCRDVVPEDCAASDAVYHGELTSCADTPCNFGACCDACGRCIGDEIAPEACTARGGVTHWPAISCPAPGSQQEHQLCPATTGACCMNDHCEVRCATECSALGGVYHGNGTDCTPNACIGACCMTSIGCSERTQSSCALFGGTYRGDGTECKSLLPALECGGGCCFQPNGGQVSCIHVNHRDDCRFDPNQKTEYLGDTSLCGACDFAGPKACCAPDGTCINTPLSGTNPPTSAVCDAMKGEFHSDAQCNADTCTRSACCTSDGTCRLTTQRGCTDVYGGTYHSEQLGCDVGFCDATGACCGMNAGNCTVKTKADCEVQIGGGVYLGDTTTCGTPSLTCPGYGACCEPNSASLCQDKVTKAYCALVNGSDAYYNGDTSKCSDPDTSCDQRGACCSSTGTCLFISETDCLALSPPGSFGGIGSGCGGNPCIRHGACCRMSGLCEDGLTSDVCDAPFEIFADGADCQHLGCLARGACCTADGQCQDAVTHAECDTMLGAFAGVGSLCSTDADMCKFGGCCDDSAAPGQGCTQKSKLACALSSLHYRAPGVSCEDALCGEGACCVLGSNQCQVLPPHGTSPTGCLDRSGAVYSGSGVACEADTCMNGACCLANQSPSCQSRTRQSCESLGGTYLGAGMVCTPNSCNFCTQSIVSSDPATCEIDARQPHDPGDISIRQGLQSIEITFSCSPSGLTPADFTITSTGGSANPSPTPPQIAQITPLPANKATITFDVRIPDGAYTCITHQISQTFTCVGSLPGDVDGNSRVAGQDICVLVGDFVGINESAICTTVTAPALVADKYDLDRSGAHSPLDILTAIDLQNGARAFSVWKDATLPTPCPTPSP